MSDLTTADAAFVQRRQRLAGLWPVAGAAILLSMTGLVGYLWLEVPYLIDPWFVADRLATDTLKLSTLHLMAAMLPVVMLMLCLFVFVITLLLFAAFRNERRLVRLIRQLDRQSVRES